MSKLTSGAWLSTGCDCDVKVSPVSSAALLVTQQKTQNCTKRGSGPISLYWRHVSHFVVIHLHAVDDKKDSI